MTAIRELAVAEREAPGSQSGSKRTYRELPRLSRRYQWRGVDPAYVQAGAVFWGRIRPGERGYVLVSSTGRAALASGTSRDERDAPAAPCTVDLPHAAHAPDVRQHLRHVLPVWLDVVSGFAVGSNHPLSDGVVCRSAPEQRRH